MLLEECKSSKQCATKWLDDNDDELMPATTITALAQPNLSRRRITPDILLPLLDYHNIGQYQLHPLKILKVMLDHCHLMSSPRRRRRRIPLLPILNNKEIKREKRGKKRGRYTFIRLIPCYINKTKNVGRIS